MTPNEQDAAIAREYAIRLHENSYIRNGIAGPNAFIQEVSRVILEAANKIAVLRGRAPNTSS